MPSKTLKEPLRDVLRPFDNHSHFFFSPKPPQPPLFLPPSQNCWENIAALNVTFLTDDLVNIQRKITQKVYIPDCLCPIVSAINIYQEIQTKPALKISLVAFMLIWHGIRSPVLNKLSEVCVFFLFRCTSYKRPAVENRINETLLFFLLYKSSK